MVNWSAPSRAQCVRFLAPRTPASFGLPIFFSDEKPKIKKQLPKTNIKTATANSRYCAIILGNNEPCMGLYVSEHKCLATSEGTSEEN